MENASKALLIAGEILIAILILSLAVYLITSYRSTSDTYYETMSAQEIEKFNNQFLKYIEYEGGQAKISAENLITIANLATDLTNNDSKPDVTVSFSMKTNENVVSEIRDNTNNYYEPYENPTTHKIEMKMILYNVNINYINGRITGIQVS